LCFFERCEERLTDPSWRQVNAEVAHIKGDRPGSARYDPDQSKADRQGYENLMLLCPKHHKEIDRLRPDAYPVEVLQAMRTKHLEHAGAEDWAAEVQFVAFARQAVAFAAAASALLPAEVSYGMDSDPRGSNAAGIEGERVQRHANDDVSGTVDSADREIVNEHVRAQGARTLRLDEGQLDRDVLG
jgi:hypothetical protein